MSGSFPAKDMTRRPIQFVITIFGIASAVATTVFFLLYSLTIGAHLVGLFTIGYNASLYNILSNFLTIVIIMSFILGAVLLSSITSSFMMNRSRDIGLLKSIGALVDFIYDHFMVQVLILALIGGILGVIFGISIFYINSLFYGQIVYSDFPALIAIGTIVIFLILAYYFGQRPVFDAINTPPVISMRPDLTTPTNDAFEKLGHTFKIASRMLHYRKNAYRRVFVATVVTVSLITVLVVGGNVTKNTTSSYVMNAMGTNVVLVGAEPIVSSYWQASNISYVDGNYSSIDWTASSSLISEQVISDIASINGVSFIDRRVISYERVEEIAHPYWDTYYNKYMLIGDHHVKYAFVIGFNPSLTVANWYIDGKSIPNTKAVVAMVGTGIAEMFEDYTVEHLQARSANFEMCGVVFDVIHGSNVVYTHYDEWSSVLGINSPNLLLVKLKYYSQDVIQQIQQVAQNNGFVIKDLNQLVKFNLDYLDRIWSFLTPLEFMAMLIAVISLSSFTLASLSNSFRDLSIIWSIGGNSKKIAKISLAQGLILTLDSGLPGIGVGFLVSIFLLIPNSVISLGDLILAGSLIVMLFIVSVVIAIPTYMLFKKMKRISVNEYLAYGL